MPERSLEDHLNQIQEDLNVAERNKPELSKEIALIRKQVETYQIGLSRVGTKQMVSAILASLEDLQPRIDAIIPSDFSARPTWPSPAPEMEETPSVRP